MFPKIQLLLATIWLLLKPNSISAIYNGNSIEDYDNEVRLRHATYQISQSINYSVDACSDFYEFACGNWNRFQNIPDGMDVFDHYEIAKGNVELNLKTLFERNANQSMEDLFYHKCLDKGNIINMNILIYLNLKRANICRSN